MQPIQEKALEAATQEALERARNINGVNEDQSKAIENLIMPKKFFVLGMIGQSNNGYGEDAYDISKGLHIPNPRIWQLGRYITGESNSGHTTTKDQFGYGDMFEQMRPYDDCNLQLIPSAPDLDGVQNLFNVQVGGCVGFGHYLAQALLPHIPSDYGIIIVPSFRGGSGFTSGNDGTYDETRKSASENAMRWGVDKPLYLDFKSRMQHALDLNTDNMLLPICVTQGEADAGNAETHKEAFEALILDFKSLIETNYIDRLPNQRIDELRFMCMSSTKWMYGIDTDIDYKNLVTTTSNQDQYSRISIYDNYCLLHNKYKNDRGESLVNFVRIDVDENGYFTETNRESGNGATTSTRQIHFSTKSNVHDLPRMISNAFLQCGSFSTSKGSPMNRDVRGGIYSYLLDKNKAVYDIKPKSFNTQLDLLIHQDFSIAESAATTIFKKDGVGITTGVAGDIVTLANDLYPKAMLFNGTSNRIGYDFNSHDNSNTKHIVFKPDPTTRDSRLNILSSGSAAHHASGILWIVNGILTYAPNLDDAQINMLCPISEINNWNGNYDDWQSVTVTTDFESRIITVFLNGKPMMTATAPSVQQLDILYLGAYGNSYEFKGHMVITRIYERSLSAEEVLYMHMKDLKILPQGSYSSALSVNKDFINSADDQYNEAKNKDIDHKNIHKSLLG